MSREYFQNKLLSTVSGLVMFVSSCGSSDEKRGIPDVVFIRPEIVYSELSDIGIRDCDKCDNVPKIAYVYPAYTLYGFCSYHNLFTPRGSLEYAHRKNDYLNVSLIELNYSATGMVMTDDKFEDLDKRGLVPAFIYVPEVMQMMAVGYFQLPFLNVFDLPKKKNIIVNASRKSKIF